MSALLSRTGYVGAAVHCAGDDPEQILAIVRAWAERDREKAWEVAREVSHGSSRALVQAELAEGSHDTDEARAHRWFDTAIETVFEIRDRMGRESAEIYVAVCAARCGCFEKLACLMQDPRRSEELPYSSTAYYSEVRVTAEGRRRLSCAIVSSLGRRGEVARALEHVHGLEDSADRCAAWSALGPVVGTADEETANQAFEEAERLLNGVEEDSERSALATSFFDALVVAGRLDRACELAQRQAGSHRRASIEATIRGLVRTRGVAAGSTFVSALPSRDEGSEFLFEAALEQPEVEPGLLLGIAQEVSPVAVSQAARRLAERNVKDAPRFLEEAAACVQECVDDQARRQGSIEVAAGLAALGRTRAALEMLPRLNPEESVEALAEWPDALEMLAEGLQVLMWVRPEWERAAATLRECAGTS